MQNCFMSANQVLIIYHGNACFAAKNKLIYFYIANYLYLVLNRFIGPLTNDNFSLDLLHDEAGNVVQFERLCSKHSFQEILAPLVII